VDSTDNERFKSFTARSDKLKDRDRVSGVYKVREALIDGDLDTTITLRINSKLKAHFEELCKIESTTVSREVKRYITEAVRIQKLI